MIRKVQSAFSLIPMELSLITASSLVKYILSISIGCVLCSSFFCLSVIKIILLILLQCLLLMPALHWHNVLVMLCAHRSTIENKATPATHHTVLMARPPEPKCSPWARSQHRHHCPQGINTPLSLLATAAPVQTEPLMEQVVWLCPGSWMFCIWLCKNYNWCK